jgi:DNA-binding response OmpR family regulator
MLKSREGLPQTSLFPCFMNKPLMKLRGNQKSTAKRLCDNSIMIVEDDKIVAKLLSHILTQRGFSVEVAADGLAAAEKVKNQQPPKLILLDIILPFFDGFEILLQIRSQKGWKKVPVVIVTSKTQEQNIVRAFENGANDYITKPFQLEELMARINRCLQ